MGNKFASGKHAIAECDRCGQRYKLKELKKLIIKTKQVSIKVCPSCWEEDQPQLSLGMYPISDPQALREPRPDNSYYQSGVDAEGDVGSGSRMIQWGWNPIGGARANDNGLTPNYLVVQAYLGDVTVTVS